MCQNANGPVSANQLSQLKALSSELASLTSTLCIEFDNLTPDEQKDEIYQLTVKCRDMQNLYDHSYEVHSEFARAMGGE